MRPGEAAQAVQAMGGVDNLNMNPGQAGDTGFSTTMCSLHMKTRSTNNMVGDGVGGLRCGPGFECKVTTY